MTTPGLPKAVRNVSQEINPSQRGDQSKRPGLKGKYLIDKLWQIGDQTGRDFFKNKKNFECYRLAA